MADGSSQRGFGFRPLPPSRLRPGEIVVDLFAGGGGASVALEQALQRPVDIAINHDPIAIGMHTANHSLTKHVTEDIRTADPEKLCRGRPVGHMHVSSDCTHFSQAKGGQPRSVEIRSLSWMLKRWAGTVRPRQITFENVVQVQKWGRLVAKRDKATGRVVRLDGTVAPKGERTPLDQQFLIPDKRHEGRTWRRFVNQWRDLGYDVEFRKIKACDYGAGTSRTRLFGVGRCDGEPIRWPAPTHGPDCAKLYITAADSIDWTIPCPSIFERVRPLADATCRRIASGVHRYVLDAAEPFIVPPQHTESGVNRAVSAGSSHACAGNPVDEPHDSPRRVAGSTPNSEAPPNLQKEGGRLSDPQVQDGMPAGLVAPHLTEFANATRGATWSVEEPLRTQCAGVKGGHFAMIAAFLEQANGGGPHGNPARCRGAHEPVSAITASGSQQRVVTCTLSPEAEAGALRVAAFLVNYYSNGQPRDVREPIGTITTRDRLALVTVTIRGTPYVIVDIGLRMLKPHELYRAQGFPADYIIDRTAAGQRLTISQQVRMVGNSVSPPPLRAIVDANLTNPVEFKSESGPNALKEQTLTRVKRQPAISAGGSAA